jgi:archaellin
MLYCNAIMADWYYGKICFNNRKKKTLYCNAILQLNIALMNGQVTKMNNYGTTGITAITLLGSVLMASAATSIMMQNTDDISATTEQAVSDIINEVTTYLKINDVMGKYYTDNGARKVERLIILLEQPTQTSVIMSDLTIKLSNDNDVILLGFSGQAARYTSEGLFANSVWGNTTNTFSLIVINDDDDSIIQHQVMNGDTAFIAINLPPIFCLGDDQSLTLSIIPSKGLVRSVLIETPSFHISDLINFGNI